MCPPLIAALPALAMVATAASGGLAAYGQVKNGQAQQAAANYQSQTDLQNRTTALNNADRAATAATQAEDQLRTRTASLAGSQQAAMAANGGEIGSGSNADILGDTARQGEQDAFTLRSNYWDRVNGYTTQADNFGREATLSTAAGKNAAQQGLLGAGGTLLSTAASVGSQWRQYQIDKAQTAGK